MAQAALPEFLLRQRWYPAKDAGQPNVEAAGFLPFPVPNTPAAVAIWRVTPPSQPAMLLFVPLAVVPLGRAAENQTITTLPPESDDAGQVVEAFSVDAFVRAWIEAMLHSGNAKLEREALHAGRTDALSATDLVPGDAFAVHRSKAEQSNTSIRVGDGAILKVIRRLEVGVNPELEVGRFLTDEANFAATPALLGWTEWTAPNGDGPITLSVLQAFVPNDGDGWSWIAERLAQPNGHAETVTWLRRLGERTAEMHHAFAIDTADPAFQREPVTDADRTSWISAVEAMAHRAFQSLATMLDRLDPNARGPAEDLLARRGMLEELLRNTLAEAPTFTKIRHHGDYHLGQVLVADHDAVIVDFEGEPLRPLAERRSKHAALRDVAGMLRSIAYAAAQAAQTNPSVPSAAWETQASQAYLEGYHAAASGGAFVPAERAVADAVLRFFMVEKALYEVAYELANRPGWVAIPVRGVLGLLDPVSGKGASSLDALAERMGIEPRFQDARGRTVEASADTKRKLLTAMGVDAADEARAKAALQSLDHAEWDRPLPPIAVTRADAGPIAVEVVLPSDTRELTWRLTLEDGNQRSGQADFASLPLLAESSLDGRERQRRRLTLAESLPWGYHRLSINPGGAAMTLVVSPGQCWLPPAMAAGRRLWGIAAQLYLLRSATDWGTGDHGDLRSLVELASARGADVIGLNPLHAMFHDDPGHASPYSPASRLLLNILNIDVLGIPELLDSRETQALIATADFRAKLEACRSEPLVDYAAVTAMKLSVLEPLFDQCRKAADQTRWHAFEAFRREHSPVLERSCLFLALREHFATHGEGQADWHTWPDAFRDPTSPAVAGFATEHQRRIDFLAWLQWIADTQLGAAAATAAERGMAIGLYRDLAVGADRAGAETWANASAVVSGAQVGAPPDIFNPAGQDWGLPPFHPRALREEGYQSFIDLVRANVRHAGGLRIDHVMGLQHLYWVPQGEKPSEGAYVAYPLDDLVGILALESQRQRCLVVGEDLGTVPEGFRERMAAANILSYRVLFFEQDGQSGDFVPADAYPSLAVAVVGSHDLPTLRGWWEERDIDLKEELGLFPEPEEADRQRATRQRDKAKLLTALRKQNVLGDEEPDIQHLARAAHAFLAKTTSLLAMAQIDDLTDEVEPVNVPATSYEHPNWRRRLSMTLEELASHPRFTEVAGILAGERGGKGDRLGD